MTREELDRSLFAAALALYKVGDYDRAWRLSFGVDTGYIELDEEDP